MKTIFNTILAVLITVSSAAVLYADDSFTVTNNTEAAITRLLAREVGAPKWGFFDIGSGIPAGETVTISWNNPDEGNCEWEFKAEFDDGSESVPITLDTCENHDIEFSESEE